MDKLSISHPVAVMLIGGGQFLLDVFIYLARVRGLAFDNQQIAFFLSHNQKITTEVAAIRLRGDELRGDVLFLLVLSPRLRYFPFK